METFIPHISTKENLSNFTFQFCRADGSHEVARVRLLPGGIIDGYLHKNESSWALFEGDVALLTRDGRPSTIFNRVTKTDGKIVLEGDFLLRPELKIVHQLRQVDGGFHNRQRHHKLTAKMLEADIEKFGWTIGDHSYGAPKVIENPCAKLHIGKFCSIAAGVLIALGNHRIDGVTTYPFATLAKFWPSMRGFTEGDHVSKGDVCIGNDVWIGYGATILSGVTIGDGAVIGAHSLVTKDVPPFAVYGGNPGKVLKYRHTPEVIDNLMLVAWWNWDDLTLDERLPLMMSNLPAFLEKYR
ncbi:Acetyltransferase (isoleucine patch superfamily) [Pseudomonas sp. ok272]|uniref:CatB-related O-acetyltransferase n=1 Tax=unclassified Pseudomonas TaxID=196821 RepID=UPI0008B89E2D|nr:MULTISPECIES: CatB-related O-acetyltransferase [unclassified Pseudomonas]SEM49279.1 Acetyltransferase (isoleucine patch superfamily) [Pseudomonas sp. ok272]SFM20779.1 Acetyltransferase (isoleucine patch superfamily) [Pseudomonas sp. ok602]